MVQLVSALTVFVFIYKPFFVPLDVFSFTFQILTFANNVTNSPNNACLFHGSEAFVTET